MYSIRIEYIKAQNIYRVVPEDYSENKLFPLAQLFDEVVWSNWTQDFEQFLFDDTADTYGSNESHVQKKEDKLLIYPFSGKHFAVSKRAFYSLFTELKQAFAVKTTLLTVSWDGQKFMVEKHTGMEKIHE